MDFPSPELSQQFAELGIAVPGDLKRCAGTARRLARGLPVTGTVWIDALVTQRLLTPFQARRLEEERGTDLIQGGKYVLQTPRIRHPLLHVTEARERRGRSLFLLSSLAAGPTESEEAQARLNITLENLSHCRDQIPGLPVDAFWDRNRLCQVSPFQPGDPLSQLLVRRGRFPEPVVRGIALELVRQLQAAEPYALHGDLRLDNVWLTHRGGLMLLNWGLLNSRSPVLTIHTPMPDEVADHIAPERFESHGRICATTEIYALGCLLWQLLAGRPPFLLTDPLAKITAHRTRTIPDVRTVSPDTSEGFATLIRTMTSRDPVRRIQSFSELFQQLSGGTARRNPLPKFSRSFETVAPLREADSAPRRRSRIPQMAAGLLITLVLSGLAWNRNQIGLPALTRVEATEPAVRPVDVNRQHQELRTAALSTNSTPAVPPVQEALPLPEPIQGRLTLESGRRYLAGTMTFPGDLVITTDARRPGVIEIGSTSLTLAAKTIRLENLHVTVQESERPVSPIQIQSETLAIDHSLIWGEAATRSAALISWTPTVGQQSGRLLIRNSEVVARGQDVIQCHEAVSAVLLENSRIEQCHLLLNLTQGARKNLRVPVMLNACTFQNCGPLVALPTGRRLEESGRISLQGANSLVDLRLGEGLIELHGADSPEGWERHVEISAQGIVTPQEIIVAVQRNDLSQQLDELDSEALTIGGLISGRYRFQPTGKDAASRDRLDIEALPVRFSPDDPGADLSRLPSRSSGTGAGRP